MGHGRMTRPREDDMKQRRDDIGGPAAQGVRGVPLGKLPDKADPITAPVLNDATPRPEPWDKKPDPKNPWELFDDHPEFSEATRAMDAGIKHAATLGTWDKARAYMHTIQDHWAHVGADDTEPRSHIMDRLNAIFGEAHEIDS
jgi:hypothetical protein